MLHANTALDEVSAYGQSQAVWFPSGITPCTVLTDPGTAFAEFYWGSFSRPTLNNCATIAAWIGAPCANVCCAIQQYYQQTKISCSDANCGCRS
jgi:hypothetical protein